MTENRLPDDDVSIYSIGRRGSTVVPNWRWEDPDIDPYELRIAGWLASHTDGYLRGVTRNMIARKVNVSAGKVTSALVTLEQRGIVIVETVRVGESEGGKRLRIGFDFDVWEGYPQGEGAVITRPARSSRDQEGGHDMTGGGHHMTTSVHHLEEQERTTPSNPQTGSRENESQNEEEEVIHRDDGFDEFWALYPRKVEKQASKRAWKKLSRDDRQTALGILTLHVGAWRDAKKDPKYIPHPSTWLNGRRWEDEDIDRAASEPERPKPYYLDSNGVPHSRFNR